MDAMGSSNHNSMLMLKGPLFENSEEIVNVIYDYQHCLPKL